MLNSIVWTFALLFAAFITLLCAILAALRENKRKREEFIKQIREEINSAKNQDN